MRRRYGKQEGQAAAELVAVLPALLFAALIAVQLALAGWALWSAGAAARAGARTAAVGGDVEKAVRRALPGPMRDGSKVREGPPVRAVVKVPRVLPGLPRFSVSAATSIDPEGDG